MSARRRLVAVIALLAIVFPRTAIAGPRLDPTGTRSLKLVHGFWSLVAGASARSVAVR